MNWYVTLAHFACVFCLLEAIMFVARMLRYAYVHVVFLQLTDCE